MCEMHTEVLVCMKCMPIKHINAPPMDKVEYSVCLINKPAAQAACTDPSQCNSTSRQNPPVHQSCRTF